MLFLVSLFLVLQHQAGKALPLSSRADPEDSNAALRRTLSSIITSCLTTTFICSWVTIPTNIPPAREEGLRAVLRKLRIMFWAFLIPELILSWSVRQWYAAGKIALIYNRRNDPAGKVIGTRGCRAVIREVISVLKITPSNPNDWTRTHGHFVGMGGIILVQQQKPERENDSTTNGQTWRAILNAEMLTKLVEEDPTFSICLSEKDITDKAKSDFLSKTISTLQVTWFIVQVIIRFQQRLAVTELEITTLALASMNGLMYIFWWCKPLGVTRPVEISINRPGFDISIGCGGKQDGRTFVNLIMSEIPKLFKDTELKFVNLVHNNQGHPHNFIWRLIFLLSNIVLVLFSPLITLCVLVFASLFDVMATNAIPLNVDHVPTFYYPDFPAQEFLGTMTLPISGFLFGGIHLVGWKLSGYQTAVDRMIWRVCSVVITANPPLCASLWAIAAGINKLVDPYGSTGWSAKLLKSVVYIINLMITSVSIVLATAYVVARLVLLAESMQLLRRQPDSAFVSIDLSRYVPHF